MTNQKRCPTNNRRPIHRGSLRISIPWLAALLASLASSAHAQHGNPQPEDLKKAKDAYALLAYNQTRCLDIASGRLQAIERGPQAVDDFANESSGGELTVAFRSLRITSGLISAVAPGMPLAGKNLDLMQDAQVEICSQSGSGAENWLTKVAFELQVQAQNTIFNTAERRLARIIPLSAGEMQAILARYHGELYGFGGSGGGPGTATEGDPIADRAITAEEYEKKKEAYKDWQAEQQRIERWKLEQEQKRRDYLEEQQRQGLNQPTPEVGLKEGVVQGPKYQPVADPARMARWQRQFQTKLGPFRGALTEYLKLKHGTRKLLQDACWKFSEESRKLVEDKSVTTAPDPRLGPKVKDALSAFQQAGLACVRTSPDAAKPLLRQGEAGLGDVAELLRAYRLSF